MTNSRIFQMSQIIDTQYMLSNNYFLKKFSSPALVPFQIINIAFLKCSHTERRSDSASADPKSSTKGVPSGLRKGIPLGDSSIIHKVNDGIAQHDCRSGIEVHTIKKTQTYFLEMALVLMFFVISNRPVQSQNSLDSLFDSFPKANTEIQKILIDKIFDRLNDCDTTYARNQSERLVKLTATHENKWFYIKSLIYYSDFGNPNVRLKILNEAYQLAAKDKEYELMGFAQVSKSMIFKDNMQYDSAMVSILKAKSHFESANNNNELVTVIHVIGDLYYYSSLYNKAEETYKKVLELKGEPVAWRAWRKVVITNNLGLLEKDRGNYAKAANYFNNSLNYILSYKDTPLNKHDSVRLGYVYHLLAEVYSFQKDYIQSQYYFAKALPIVSKYKLIGMKIRLYLTKGRLYNYFSRYDSSLQYLKKALDLNKKEYGSPALAAAIYKELSDTYGKLKDFKNAWFAKSEYNRLSDSLNTVIQESIDMEILAEYNYDAYLTKIKTYEREKIFFFSIILILLLSLIVILFIYFRLKRSDLRLVQKNIELVRAEEYHKSLSRNVIGAAENTEELRKSVSVEPVLKSGILDNDEKGNDGDNSQFDVEQNDISIVQLRSLVSELEEVISKSRLFLNPDLTLDELSERLNTNRTYLSRAINKVFDMNYHSYINALRIKEAVRIISNKELALYKIEGIAKEVGFKNRTSFIAAFRKYTGVTPSFFIRNLHSK